MRRREPSILPGYEGILQEGSLPFSQVIPVSLLGAASLLAHSAFCSGFNAGFKQVSSPGGYSRFTVGDAFLLPFPCVLSRFGKKVWVI